jgi:hypothetical protein
MRSNGPHFFSDHVPWLRARGQACPVTPYQNRWVPCQKPRSKTRDEFFFSLPSFPSGLGHQQPSSGQRALGLRPATGEPPAEAGTAGLPTP